MRLPWVVGSHRANWMILSAVPIDAHTAQNWGLVLEVVAERDLLTRASQIALTLARSVPDIHPERPFVASAIGVPQLCRANVSKLARSLSPVMFNVQCSGFLDARQARRWG